MLKRIDRWLYRHARFLWYRGGVWGLIVAVAGMVVVLVVRWVG